MANVLLLAPGANRDEIGEAWVAYQWASKLSDHHRVTLLTYRKRDRSSCRDQLPGVRVVEWLEPPFLSKVERFNSLLKPWYGLFYRQARAWIRRALEQGEIFDVAHQPVPVAMRYPSPLAGLGIPYVLGPVGGSMTSPDGFEEEDTAPWYVGLRKLDALRLRFDPMLRRSYSSADTVMGIAPYVDELLSAVPLKNFVVMSETGVEEIPDPVDRSGHGEPVTLLFVGRLVRTKGARDAVRAMAHLRDLPAVLDIVGDGFDRAACESLATELGVQASVHFHGARARSEVNDFYRRADVFVFPSYREPGGNVAFEAMSYGLPLVVSDRGGPGYVVDDASGFRVTPTDPEQFALGIAAAVRTLVEDPELRHRQGAAARTRASQMGTWAQRINQVDAIYEKARTDA